MSDVLSSLFANLSREQHQQFKSLLKSVTLPPAYRLTRSGETSAGVYFLWSKLVTVPGRVLTIRDVESIAAPGLQELILSETAKLDLLTNRETDAFFLPADSFYQLLRQSDWFPDYLLRMVAADGQVQFTSTHFVQEDEQFRLEKLVEASKILNSTLDLNQLLNVILDTSLSSVNGDRGTLYLIDEKKNELWSKVLDGSRNVTITLPVGKGIAGFVAQTGDTVNISDAQSDPRFNPEVDRRTGYVTRTILCMPLRNKQGKILGVFQLLNKKDGKFTPSDEAFIESLSIHAAIAIENARLYEQEQQKIALDKEMSAAADVQRSLFPKNLPEIPGYALYAHNIPASQVSGDMFDVISLNDGRTVFTLGDVSGKGLPAAILMANMQSVMRDLPHQNPSPEYCASRLNRMIYRSSGFDKFITVFIGLLDPAANTLTYANAGHDYPFLFRSDGSHSRLESTGIPIGMLGESSYTQHQLDMNPGDMLFVFSDGVTDAASASGDMYGEERMQALVAANMSRSPAEVVQILEAELLAFIGSTPQFDDMTILVLKRTV